MKILKNSPGGVQIGKDGHQVMKNSPGGVQIAFVGGEIETPKRKIRAWVCVAGCGRIWYEFKKTCPTCGGEMEQWKK